VLGTAKIARDAVSPGIRSARNGELVAVASRDEERARAFAESEGIPAWHAGYPALLDDPGVDAVYVPLPNSEHREWTIRALERGKHVLCEKPLGLGAAECREMQAAADANGRVLMEAFMYRFHPRTERLLERVRAGDVGEVRMVRSAFGFHLADRSDIRMRPDLGGGALMDVGCYCVNVSRTIAGVEPAEVQAFARWSEGGVDEELVGTLRFGSGIVAHFDCSFTMPVRQFVEVAGTGGSLEAPWAFRPGPVETVIQERRGSAPEREEVVPPDDEYRRMVEHFGDAVLEDASLRYPASEGARNMAVIEALYRSAREGGRVVEVVG
jgi:predicted dehydrogenase